MLYKKVTRLRVHSLIQWRKSRKMYFYYSIIDPRCLSKWLFSGCFNRRFNCDDMMTNFSRLQFAAHSSVANCSKEASLRQILSMMDFASVKLLLVSHHELYLVSVKLSKLENILQQCAPQQENHSLHNCDTCYHMITFLNLCQWNHWWEQWPEKSHFNRVLGSIVINFKWCHEF